MANSIALATKYLPYLDAAYKKNVLTSMLDAQNVRWDGSDTVKVYKTSLNGLGDYDRNSGFVSGSVTGTWETMQLTQDRGRSFSVDRMDNEETLDMAFGTLAGEFLRVNVAPEIDSYRFATMAGWSGISSATAADFSSGAHDVIGALDAAEEQMNDDEVPREGRILFISENAYKFLKGDVTRSIGNEMTFQNGFENINGMRIVRVPSSRFSTAITLYDGSSGGETAGGYIQTATTGYPINFMIVHPSAVLSVVKHVIPRIFSPDVNQSADAWKFDYRIYHDLFVMDNKVDGIYLHRQSTANA